MAGARAARAPTRAPGARSPRPPRAALAATSAPPLARDALALLGRVPVPLAGAVEVGGALAVALSPSVADRVRDPRPAARASPAAAAPGAAGTALTCGAVVARLLGNACSGSSAAAALARLALPAGGGGGRDTSAAGGAAPRRRAGRRRAGAPGSSRSGGSPSARRRRRRRRRREIVQSRHEPPIFHATWVASLAARRRAPSAVPERRRSARVDTRVARSTSFHETRGGARSSPLARASSSRLLARAARRRARAQLLPFDARADGGARRGFVPSVVEAAASAAAAASSDLRTRGRHEHDRGQRRSRPRSTADTPARPPDDTEAQRPPASPPAFYNCRVWSRDLEKSLHTRIEPARAFGRSGLTSCRRPRRDRTKHAACTELGFLDTREPVAAALVRGRRAGGDPRSTCTSPVRARPCVHLSRCSTTRRASARAQRARPRRGRSPTRPRSCGTCGSRACRRRRRRRAPACSPRTSSRSSATPRGATRAAARRALVRHAPRADCRAQSHFEHHRRARIHRREILTSSCASAASRARRPTRAAVECGSSSTCRRSCSSATRATASPARAAAAAARPPVRGPPRLSPRRRAGQG